MGQEISAAHAGSIDLGDRRVHRLGLGTNRLTDTDAARALLIQATDLGVNFIDTADVYQSTASETTIGNALGSSHPEVLVATKGGLIRTSEGLGRDASPKHLREAIEGSLRRLKTDRIELYQLHRPDPQIPIEASVGTLRELQQEGRIRQIGVSNVTVEELERARRIATIVSVQNQYNILDRESEPVLDYCEAHSIAFIAWTPLIRGKLDRAPRLAEMAHSLGVSPHQLALRWLLRRSPAILPIPGTLSPEHLRENLAAAEIELSADEFAELSR